MKTCERIGTEAREFSIRMRSVLFARSIVKLFTLLDLCVLSLRRGHANLLCIVPTLTDDPRREPINLCFCDQQNRQAIEPPSKLMVGFVLLPKACFVIRGV